MNKYMWYGFLPERLQVRLPLSFGWGSPSCCITSLLPTLDSEVEVDKLFPRVAVGCMGGTLPGFNVFFSILASREFFHTQCYHRVTFQCEMHITYCRLTFESGWKKSALFSWTNLVHCLLTLSVCGNMCTQGPSGIGIHTIIHYTSFHHRENHKTRNKL